MTVYQLSMVCRQLGRSDRVLRGGRLLLVLLSLHGGGCQSPENRMTVENRSGQVISAVTVSLRDAKSRFENIATDAKVSASFKILGDDHFVIEGRLMDGTVFTGKYGYVTRGMQGEQIFFTVRPLGAIEYKACHEEALSDTDHC